MRGKILAVLAAALFVATALLPILSVSEGASTNGDYVFVMEDANGIEVRYEASDPGLYNITITDEKVSSPINIDIDIFNITRTQVVGKTEHFNDTPVQYNVEFALNLRGGDYDLETNNGMEYLITISGGYSGNCKLKCVEANQEVIRHDDGSETVINTVENTETKGSTETKTTVVETVTTDVSGNSTVTRTDSVKTTDTVKSTSETTTKTIVQVTDASGAVVNSTRTETTSIGYKEGETVVEEMESVLYSLSLDGKVKPVTYTKTTEKTTGNKVHTESTTNVILEGEFIKVISDVVTDGNKVTTDRTTETKTQKSIVHDEVTTTKVSETEKQVHTETSTENQDSGGSKVSTVVYTGDSTHKSDYVKTTGKTVVKDANDKEVETVNTTLEATTDANGSIWTTTTDNFSVDGVTKSTVTTYTLDDTKSTAATAKKAVTTIIGIDDKTTNASPVYSSETTVKTDDEKAKFDVAYVNNALEHALTTCDKASITASGVDKYVNFNVNGDVNYTVAKDTIDRFKELTSSKVGFKLTGSYCSVAYDYNVIYNNVSSDWEIKANTSKGNLTQDQKRVIGDNPFIEISLTCNGTTLTDLKGNCTFTIDFNGIVGMGYEMYKVADDGQYAKNPVDFVFDAYNSQVIGVTTHHCVFAVFPTGYVPPSEEKDNTMIIVAVVVILIILLLLAYYYDKQRKAKAASSFEQPVPPQQAPAQQSVNDQPSVQEQSAEPQQPVQEQPAQQQTAPATETQPSAQPTEPQQPANDTQSSWDKENKPDQ